MPKRTQHANMPDSGAFPMYCLCETESSPNHAAVDHTILAGASRRQHASTHPRRRSQPDTSAPPRNDVVIHSCYHLAACRLSRLISTPLHKPPQHHIPSRQSAVTCAGTYASDAATAVNSNRSSASCIVCQSTCTCSLVAVAHRLAWSTRLQ